MSRILIWSPGYAPELIGIPPLVTDAADWLAEAGHQVTVVTPIPNNPNRCIHPEYRGVLFRTERRGEVSVARSWLWVRPQETFADKVLSELTFATLSTPRVLRRLSRLDVLVCVVPSLLAGFYASRLVRAKGAFGRRTRFVLWVQDLVLSAALAVESSSPRSRFALRVATALEGVTAREADRLIVCSPGFESYLTERGVKGSRIVTIYNWVDTDEIAPSPSRRDDSCTRFLYAGNLGYTQGFETLVEAARLAGPAIQVQIVGGGNRAKEVRQLANGAPNVDVRPPVPRADFSRLLASADAHVVLQRRVSSGANLPSKIASYLASGKPILASIDSATPAAELLRASEAAVLVRPEAPSELARAMHDLHEQVEWRKALGAKGRAYATQNLDRKGALARLERAILG